MEIRTANATGRDLKNHAVYWAKGTFNVFDGEVLVKISDDRGAHSLSLLALIRVRLPGQIIHCDLSVQLSELATRSHLMLGSYLVVHTVCVMGLWIGVPI